MLAIIRGRKAMRFKAISDEEVEQLRDSLSGETRIRQRIATLVERLGIIFNGKTVGGVGGLSFSPENADGVICKIEGPLGSGRLTLGWTIDKENLCGLLHVERKRRDKYDRTYWEEVWRLVVPERDGLYAAEPGDTPDTSRLSDRALEDALFKVGMRFYRALVAPPATQE
jgi:hypothetical protein